MKGDQELFTELIGLVKEKAYKIAYCCLHDEEDAMDCVCSTIEKAYMNIRKLREERFFKTWFIRITINECNMLLRKKKQAVSLAERISYAESFDAELERDLDLKELLLKLPKLERTLIYMKYYLEYTLKDISGMTGMPEGTVKTKIYNCLRQLRRKILMEGG